jgi:copper homeostasis protein
MIRPRDIDFVYSASEINEMIADIERVKKLGADGIVSGVLLPDGSIDQEATARLIEASRPLPFTFHRAFDYCTEPIKSYEVLDAMGVERLLTSGQEDKAIEGIDLINSLANINSRIQVMAASGVCADVIPELWEVGVRQFHFTSHLMDSEGVYRFDPEKVTRAHEVLERLSQQERFIPDS